MRTAFGKSGRKHKNSSADKFHVDPIANAKVDLNPHQVDAALCAIRSPLAKGAILADEVGLGKTIEPGIVMAQRWAERRRRILLILPAALRKVPLTTTRPRLQSNTSISFATHETNKRLPPSGRITPPTPRN